MENCEIDVLLATFNGEAYLPHQIDSILAQKDVILRIIARDDGSTDSTVEILESYARKFEKKFEIIYSKSNLGPKGNFSKIMEHSRSAYIAFSDQDDVWDPNKLSIEIKVIRDLERDLGRECPILVHTDLAVVDKQLSPIAESFWAYEGINPGRHSPNQLLVQNTVTGCTVLCNRSLLQRAMPIPQMALMHDHWLALVASVFGHIHYLPGPLVQYRRHQTNAIGPSRYSLLDFIKRIGIQLGTLTRLAQMRNKVLLRDHLGWVPQARAFLDIFGQDIPSLWLPMFDDVARLPECGWLARRGVVFRHGLWAYGGLRRVISLLRL